MSINHTQHTSEISFQRNPKPVLHLQYAGDPVAVGASDGIVVAALGDHTVDDKETNQKPVVLT